MERVSSRVVSIQIYYPAFIVGLKKFGKSSSSEAQSLSKDTCFDSLCYSTERFDWSRVLGMFVPLE